MKQVGFQLVLGAIILGVVASQIVVVQDYVINSQTSKNIKTFKYENKDWNNVLEFAVYGWIKPAQWINGEVQIFRLSANKDVHSNTLGDRVLKAFAQDNSITFETYDSKNWDPKVQHPRLVYGNNDFGKWIYIYQGYNPSSQKTFGYVKASSGEFYNTNNNYAVHSTSNFYQLIVGMHQEIWNADRIDIKILSLACGKGAYREKNFEMNQTPVTIGPSFKCINLFSQCGYKGKAVELCSSGADAIFPDEIKSIFIPPNFKSISLYPKKNYQGEELVFKKSFECLDPIKFKRGSVDIVKGSFFLQKTKNANKSSLNFRRVH